MALDSGVLDRVDDEMAANHGRVSVPLLKVSLRLVVNRFELERRSGFVHFSFVDDLKKFILDRLLTFYDANH